MYYLFLVYSDDIPPTSNHQAFEAACQANAAALRESGYLLAAASFQSSSTSITLRVRNGELSLAEAPTPGTERQLAELYFINARDLNEAIRLAADMPQAQRCRIEITLLADSSTCQVFPR
jgi:hypothetical protein